MKSPRRMGGAMASPEKRPSLFGPFPEYRLDLTAPLDRARERERKGDLEEALLLASRFFDETAKEILGGRSEFVPNAASAARCVVRCCVKMERPERARKFIADARSRVPQEGPGPLRLRARLREEEARLREFEETLGEFRARAEGFRSRASPSVQGHALPLGLSARHAAAACKEMGAEALGVRLLAEAAQGLLGARSTDLRPLVAALELLAAEMDRLGSPGEAARTLEAARLRAESALALFRAAGALFGAPASSDPVARLLRLEAAHRRRGGDRAGARRCLDALTRLQPGEAAVELALLGDAGPALDDLASAAPPPEEVVFVLEFRARLLLRLGREEEGRRAAREALGLFRAAERPPLEDEWYQRWLSRLHRAAGEYRRLRLREAAGEEVAPALEALASDLARFGLEVRAMERGVADEAAGHILLRAGRREAAFHSFHRALEAYREEEWEGSEHIYEDDFLMLDALGREEALLRLTDPRWRHPPERVEALMRAAFDPGEFRRFGDHAVEDYFAGLNPGPLDRDPEEVTAEIKLPEGPRG
ncbi:MAG: hypothetical protein QXO51_08345 [Halobacteria archaeon]